MGNTCVGPKLRDGFFFSQSTWWSPRSPETLNISHTPAAAADCGETPSPSQPTVVDSPPAPSRAEAPVQVVLHTPPEPLQISGRELAKETTTESTTEVQPQQLEQQQNKKKKKRGSASSSSSSSSVGVGVGLAAPESSVLRTRSVHHLKEHYKVGAKLGHGQFGTTYKVTEKATGKEFACKSIAKRKLTGSGDLDDVRREIEIMHHLEGSPSVVSVKGAYEDSVAVHFVMELCTGGELFDRIVKRGHYSEKKAANLARTIVGVVETCHSMGVIHRDLKPENFLFVDETEDSPLKSIDFGLSAFFKPGEIFRDVVGSPYYVAPEVLLKRYGPESDVWSAGVIVYVLLCGVPPFWGETEQEIFQEVLHGDLDLATPPWTNISESAKDLVRKMLVRNPKKRLTAHEVLCHPWLQVDGVAPDKPLDPAVLSRLKQFLAMNKFKKMALRVIADHLSEEEIAGLKQMFEMIDTDGSGQITFEELKVGLKRFGANLNESEIFDLMQAADVDNSGTIDYGEFIAATLHLNKVQREDHLFAAFSYFDKDGSGYITRDELQQACDEFGIEDLHLEDLIQEVDQDNDGRIDYSEFVAMMQQGNSDFGRKVPRNSATVGFREALAVC